MPPGAARLTSRILILWVALGALVPRFSPLRPLYLVNTYALLPALLGVILAGRLLQPKNWRRFRVGLADVALAVFLAGAAASIMLQDLPPAFARRDLIDLWRTFVVPITGFWAVRLARPRDTEHTEWFAPLVAICAIEVAVGLLALFSPATLPGFWPGSVPETGGVRIIGTLPQPDVFAAVLVFSAAILADLGPAAASALTRVIAGGGFALAFVGVFLSFSRASWLGGIVALGILAAAYGRRLAVPCLVIAVGVVGLSRASAGLARPPEWSPPAAVAGHPHENYAATRLTMSWTVRDRIVLDAAGLKMFLSRPVLGWGFGSYDRHSHEFVTSVGPFMPTEWDKNDAASHCTHLSILAETGVVGYGLLSFPVVQLAAASIRSRRRRPRDRFLVGLWAVEAFLAVVSVLIDLRYLALPLGLGALVLGLIAVRVEPDELES